MYHFIVKKFILLRFLFYLEYSSLVSPRVLSPFTSFILPSFQVVGDLAQIMVSNGLTGEDVVKQAGSLNFPNSVIQFLQVSLCLVR